MNESVGLIEKFAYTMTIYKGKTESERSLRTRVVYSICGRKAYASL